MDAVSARVLGADVGIAAGVVGELGEFGVNVVRQAKAFLAASTNSARDGLALRQGLPQRRQQLFVVPDCQAPCSPSGLLGSGVLGGLVMIAARCGDRRSRSRQRARFGPMLPTGMPSVVLMSA